MNNQCLKYEDLSGFDDKENNFSQKNYTRCVDKIVEILDNQENSKTIYRKSFQYSNLLSAISYSDYSEYNSCNNDWYYDDEYEEEKAPNVIENEQYEYMVKEGLTITSEIPAYTLPKNKKDTMDVYNENQEFITTTATNLSLILGADASNFLDRYISANAGILPRLEPENPMDAFADEMEFLSEIKFKVRKRVNQNQLYSNSIIMAQRVPETNKGPLYSKETQQQVLTLLSILPSDLNKNKRASFSKFLRNSFLYQGKYGENRSRPLNELQKIADIWPKLTEKQEKMDYKSILNFANSTDYINAQKLDFTEEAKIHNLSPKLFDIAQTAYLRGIDTPRIIKENYEISDGDYTIRLMDIKDPSIFFIGEGFSCQTIDKIGVYPAISSVQDPFSRAMVVEKKGKPVGLAWTWVTTEEKYGSTYNSMCIDNMELAEGVIKDTDNILGLTKRMGAKIAEENNLLRITIGSHATHYSPDMYYVETNPLEMPQSYTDQTPLKNLLGPVIYGDSEEQLLVYENLNAKPISQYDEKQYYVAHRNSYTISEDERNAALAVGDTAYPWKAVFSEEKKDKNSQFMILKNNMNKVIGYALYSDVNKSIYDVAVIGNRYAENEYGERIKISDDGDKYRRFSKIMLRELLQHMQSIGGEWKAQTRKETSYPLVKYMEHAGLVSVKEKPAGMRIENEILYDLTFTFNKKEENKNMANLISNTKQNANK